jgi:class 3 adenylate cyclase
VAQSALDERARLLKFEDWRWRDVLDQHHELGHVELARFGGREVATIGDGFLAAFDRPIAAVRCALPLWRRCGRCGCRSAPASIPGRSRCARRI